MKAYNMISNERNESLFVHSTFKDVQSNNPSGIKCRKDGIFLASKKCSSHDTWRPNRRPPPPPLTSMIINTGLIQKDKLDLMKTTNFSHPDCSEKFIPFQSLFRHKFVGNGKTMQCPADCGKGDKDFTVLEKFLLNFVQEQCGLGCKYTLNIPKILRSEDPFSTGTQRVLVT
jgi:hypothetical protein